MNTNLKIKSNRKDWSEKLLTKSEMKIYFKDESQLKKFIFELPP